MLGGHSQDAGTAGKGARKIIHWRDYLDPLRVFEALGASD